MSLNQIAPPYPVFTDLDGTPLDNGYLYIGEVSLNPETNPIVVYWDAALTQPAAQPIRTQNGYPYRNGTPSLLYTDKEFSITVRNKNRELFVYSPVGFASFRAGLLDNFSGNGSQTSFTLTAAPLNENATNVYINGIYQQKNTYNIISATLLFSQAPPFNSSIEITYF